MAPIRSLKTGLIKGTMLVGNQKHYPTIFSAANNPTITFSGGSVSVNSLASLMKSIALNSTATTTSTSGGALTLDSVAMGNYEYANIKSNTTISSGWTTSNYFSSTEDTVSSLIAIKGNLTIDSGQTFQPSVRKLFTCIYVTGNLTVNGNISMSSRGANHSATTKQNISIWKGTISGISNANVPVNGGNGAAASSGSSVAGSAGTSGGTGGGGAGGQTNVNGAGAAGTSFSGGPGGGGAAGAFTGSSGVTGGTANGGAGGTGGTSNLYSNSGGGGGGAGNPGGPRGERSAADAGGTARATAGANGTGGILIILVEGSITINSGAVISADGANGGNSDNPSPNHSGGGGGSGGGSVTIVGQSYSNSGTVRANGGSGGLGYDGGNNGGAGGAGSVRAGAA